LSLPLPPKPPNRASPPPLPPPKSFEPPPPPPPPLAAIVDLENAIAAFEQLQLEPGHLAGAKWALGKIVWKTDRARGQRLIEDAVALFAKGSASWAPAKADAEAWLRTNGRPASR